jgi:rhodanese-related sulfurtransferase
MKRTSRTILFAAVLLLAAGTLGGCLSEDQLITYDELKALIDDNAAMENTTIVDVRSAAAWKEGYIPEAINIEYDAVLDAFGGLKDGGAALTSIVTNKDGTLVIYGTGTDNASLFAARAIQSGYTEVKFYQGGMADWRESHGDYLYINYEGFRQWYDAACPFIDGENYLVDAHPPSLYTDYGHIPGAINIMSKHFASLDPGSLKPITDFISNREAKIVFYCVNYT